MTGFIGGVEETEEMSSPSSASSSLEPWMSSDSSSPSPPFFFFVFGLVGVSRSLPQFPCVETIVQRGRFLTRFPDSFHCLHKGEVYRFCATKNDDCFQTGFPLQNSVKLLKQTDQCVDSRGDQTRSVHTVKLIAYLYIKLGIDMQKIW